VTIDTAISGMPTCVRKAWLVLGGATIQLDNPSGGWMCQSLDLGTPIMRTVMTNAPDQDGIIDRTQYMGARTVTAAITALTGAGAQVDAVAASFAPYMVPSQRPVLHYVLDRPGAPERTLTLRPESYDWPIVGAAQRDIALQWIAPNPIAYDPTVHSVSAGWHAALPNITSVGDVLIRPVFQFTGALTAPRAAGNNRDASLNIINGVSVGFLNTFSLTTGQVVTVDCAAHTALLGGVSVLNQIDWANTTWPALVGTAGATTSLQLLGTGNDASALLTATWQDGYLS
jgi:hypothetical protein